MVWGKYSTKQCLLGKTHRSARVAEVQDSRDPRTGGIQKQVVDLLMPAVSLSKPFKNGSEVTHILFSGSCLVGGIRLEQPSWH